MLVFYLHKPWTPLSKLHNYICHQWMLEWILSLIASTNHCRFDLFLNGVCFGYFRRSIQNFLDVLSCLSYSWTKSSRSMALRCGSRTAATSKMELFVIIVNGFQPLTIITNCSILDVAAFIGPPLALLYLTTLFAFSSLFIDWASSSLLICSFVVAFSFCQLFSYCN